MREAVSEFDTLRYHNLDSSGCLDYALEAGYDGLLFRCPRILAKDYAPLEDLRRMNHLRIAIDGPAGAGKSTVAKEVARRLGILYVDSGAMYRGVAWLADRYGVAPDNEPELVRLLDGHPIRFANSGTGTLEVLADDQSITHQLRSPAVSRMVSELSVHPQIRSVLTKWQRDFSLRESVVMDGRDIGTVVMPDADFKFFLTADLEERVRRRLSELQAQGVAISFAQLQATLAERDERDASRAVAPLLKAQDALEVDSTGKTVEQVCEEILDTVARVHHG